MRVIYDNETDTVTIILRDSSITESDEARAGMIFDYDEDGHIVSIEILDASRHVSDPDQIVYEVARKKTA